MRSGIINSVHAFAVDSERGVFILSILGVVIGGSLLLFALRSGVVRTNSRFEPLSRETFLLLNNILLMLSLGVVFVGTLYPLYYEWVEGGRLSIGPPWFNLLFNPVFALLVVLIPVGALLNWKRHQVANLLAVIRWPVVFALLAGGLLPLLLPHYSWIAAGSIAIGAWLFAVTWQDLWRKSQHRESRWQGLLRLKGSYYGMVLAHLGIGVALLGDCPDISLQRAQRCKNGSW